MIVYQTEVFRLWLTSIRDSRTRAAILTRIDRMRLGNFGDVEPVGSGISEIRIHYGAGYRLYCYQKGQTLVVLLCGGNKSTQKRDVIKARLLRDEVEHSLISEKDGPAWH